MKRFVLAVALAGCAGSLPPALHPAITARDGQLCVDDGALRAGQSIRIERTICRTDSRRRLVCESKSVGSGEVLRTIDSHCAVVRIAAAGVAPGDRMVVAGAPSALAARRD